MFYGPRAGNKMHDDEKMDENGIGNCPLKNCH